MNNVVPISEARTKLPSLVDLAATLSQKTLVSVGGKVKAAIVNARDFELMEETIKVLGDSKSMDAIKKGRVEVKKGQLIDWEDLKLELGL